MLAFSNVQMYKMYRLDQYSDNTDGIEDFEWTCGDRINDTKVWMVHE